MHRSRIHNALFDSLYVGKTNMIFIFSIQLVHSISVKKSDVCAALWYPNATAVKEHETFIDIHIISDTLYARR